MATRTPLPGDDMKLSHDSRFQHIDLKFDAMNKRMDGFDVRFTGLEGSIALINAKSETVASSLTDVRNDIRLLVNRIESNRETDDNKPSVVRTSTLFQVLLLVFGSSGLVSGFMFLQLSPLREAITAEAKASTIGMERVDHESTVRHEAQQAWIDLNTKQLATLSAEELEQAKLHGAISRDLELLWQRADSFSEDLKDHKKCGHN